MTIPPDAVTVRSWDELHADPRHQLRYPSEHVIRWLASLPTYNALALDIGCGSGRHLDLLRERGSRAIGVDASLPAACLGVVADMTMLPFAPNTFDIALAYGVFYYGTHTDMRQAVNEMHRVLKPGGQGLVKTRTPHDWRAAGIPEGEPEHGMPMTFLDEHDIADVYAAFTHLTVELTETSTHARARWNSDWLITVTK